MISEKKKIINQVHCYTLLQHLINSYLQNLIKFSSNNIDSSSFYFNIYVDVLSLRV